MVFPPVLTPPGFYQKLVTLFVLMLVPFYLGRAARTSILADWRSRFVTICHLLQSTVVKRKNVNVYNVILQIEWM